VHFVTKVSLYFFIPVMTYFREIFLDILLQDDEIFRGVSQKVIGRKKFSMLVQDFKKCILFQGNFKSWYTSNLSNCGYEFDRSWSRRM
jgi:hypothetical protein